MSAANAKLNWQTENPGWNFDAVKHAAQAELEQAARPDPGLGRQLCPDPGVLQPAVQGLPPAQHHQRRQRPVHGLGREGAHAGPRAGEPVRDLLRLGHLPLAGPAAGDARPDGGQRHGAVAGQLLRRGRHPAAVGLPEPEQLRDGRRPVATSIIADYYAFGARQLPHQAGAGRHGQAGHDGQRRAAGRGAGAAVRLPARGRQLRLLQPARRQVPTLLEYDTEDFATGAVRQGAGRHRRRGDAPEPGQQLGEHLRPRQRPAHPAGRERRVRSRHQPRPPTTSHYVEGDAYEYLWNVPNDYAGAVLAARRQRQGRTRCCSSTCRSRTASACSPSSPTSSTSASSSPSTTRATRPGTQQAVNNIRNTMYLPGPSGLANNDDLGANSSTFIWEMLGHVPGELRQRQAGVRAAPGFPHAPIHLPPRQDDHHQRARRLADPLLRGLAEAQRGQVQQALREVLHPGPRRHAGLDAGHLADLLGQRAAGRPGVLRPGVRGHRLGQPVDVWTSSRARRARPRCRCPR